VLDSGAESPSRRCRLRRPRPSSEALLSAQYLVTGGAGFIGTAVVRSLLERGGRVAVLDSGGAAGFGYLDGLDVNLVEGDVRDHVALKRAVAGCEYVVHLAAQPSVPASIEAPMADHDVNVLAALRLLEAARAAGVRRLIFGSSNAVVAGHPPPASERLTPLPVSPYGAGKAAVEAYLSAYHRAYGLEAVALRFANAYGPWSLHKSSVVASFIRAFLDGGPITVRGDGRQTRDFVHVRDVAALILRCLDAPSEAVAGEVFQAGTGRETSLLDLVDLLSRVGGREVAVQWLAAAPGDVERNFSDVSKARRVLDFRARVELPDGLAETLDWFRWASESRPTSR
jgi:UDP-glucose 4-epimerase